MINCLYTASVWALERKWQICAAVSAGLPEAWHVRPSASPRGSSVASWEERREEGMKWSVLSSSLPPSTSTLAVSCTRRHVLLMSGERGHQLLA